MKGLYVHIPFCEHICFYCDFAKRVPKNNEMIFEYLNYLNKEYMTIPSHKKSFDTIYIGGGTPSMLDIDQLTLLFEMLKDIDPTEFTIEVNPESYTHEKGLLFKKYGINRISLGVQSFDQDILDYIGRKHCNSDVFFAVEDLKKIGISNISIDLIFSIPGQTLKTIKNDLKQLKKLDIEHVSYYALILEEKTVFYYQYEKGLFKQNDMDLEADMYLYVMSELKKQGFEQYEISNFAKNKQYSKHNTLYWTLEPYQAIGAGAHGFDGHIRYENYRNLNEYYQSFTKEIIHVSEDTLLVDAMIFGLRKLSGVNLESIKQRFGVDIMIRYPKLHKFIELELIEIVENNLRLTSKGVLLGNQVFEIFI